MVWTRAEHRPESFMLRSGAKGDHLELREKAPFWECAASGLLANAYKGSTVAGVDP